MRSNIDANQAKKLEAITSFIKPVCASYSTVGKLQGLNKGTDIDNVLMEHFEREIWNKIPHLEEKKSGESKVVNPTPLIDITEDLKQCARTEYGLDLADKDLQVFGKFDSNLLAGSIKVRPAVRIVYDA